MHFKILSRAMMQSEAIHQKGGKKEKYPRGAPKHRFTILQRKNSKKGEETPAFRRRRNTFIKSNDVMWRNMCLKKVKINKGIKDHRELSCKV